jgi:hypothetical protein
LGTFSALSQKYQAFTSVLNPIFQHLFETASSPKDRPIAVFQDQIDQSVNPRRGVWVGLMGRNHDNTSFLNE